MPTTPAPTWTDQRVEQLVGNLLRIGVMLAAAVVFIGGVYYLYRDGSQTRDYHIFTSEPGDLRSVKGIIDDTFSGHSVNIIQLGLLILLATPVARVLFSVAAFALLRDRLYVAVTLVVLAVLAYSLFAA